MPRVSTTIDDEMNDWILEQCGNKKRSRAGFIRSILYLVKNGIIIGDNSMYVPSNSRVDNWKSIDELKRKKKVSSAIPIYPAEVMGDLMGELREKLAGKRIEATTQVLIDMREEQAKIAKALFGDNLPPEPPKEEEI